MIDEGQVATRRLVLAYSNIIIVIAKTADGRDHGVNGPPLVRASGKAMIFDPHFSCTNSRLVHFYGDNVNVTILYIKMLQNARYLSI